MNYPAAFKISARCCFVGLLVGGYLGSLIFSFWLRYEDHAPLVEWVKTPLLALGILIFAAGFAVLPVAMLGLPAYAWLVQHGRNTQLSALAIPLAFALAVWLLTKPEVGALVAFFGACIALVTHEAYKVGSNNSSKPTPLRGAA